MRLEFFIPMEHIPTITHQEKDITFVMKDGKPKPVVYEPAELKAVRAKLTAHLAGHMPPTPFTGPLQCIVKWCFPCAGSHKPGDWKPTKPDTGNLNKLLLDVLTDLHCWRDDSQVCREVTEKFYNDVPGIYIAIENLIKEVP